MEKILVDFLLKPFIQEAKSLGEVADQMESLKKDVDLMKAFLKDRDGKRRKDEFVEQLVRQSRDAAHEAEDVIDLYNYNKEMWMRRSKLMKVFKSLPDIKKLYDVGHKIHDIKRQIHRVYNNNEKHFKKIQRAEASIDAGSVEAMQNRRRYVQEEDVVGFVDHSSKLIKQLTKGKRKLDVISIIGMPGLGKTTLARKVYNSDPVKRHFHDRRAWVYVSQDFRCKKVLIRILKSMMQKSEKEFHGGQEKKQPKKRLEDMSEKELRDKLKKYLGGKNYLIVLDDVWNTEDWDKIKRACALPDNGNGSRILITSRQKKVGLHASSGTSPYELPILNKKESWKLLRKKIFGGEQCPSKLEELGRKIAEKCDGLPLSIVVLGGLLRIEEKSTKKWEKFKGNINWHLGREGKCKEILALSYTDLPQHLKPCFKYVGVYPEKYKIPVRQLIQLWMAEGFIQDTGNGNMEMEDVAEVYLEELIDRSLIQVASRRTDGGVKTCGIHDLLRELCISESKEEKFLDVRTGTNVKRLTTNTKTLRLSIMCSTPLYISLNPTDPSRARSLLFFSQDVSGLDKDDWKWVRTNFQFVRVLNLGHPLRSSIPRDVGEFLLLKYLKIETEASIIIPDCIFNLWNLETMDARRSSLKCLPKEIWKLQRLRHLYLSGPVSFPDPSVSRDKALGCLQVLSTVIFDARTASLIADRKFPNLRKLGICYSSGGIPNGGQDLESLRQLSHLERLKILNCEKLPNSWDSFPSKITKITLVCVNLNVIAALGNLKKLRILKLRDSRDNYSLRVKEHSFPKLEVLKLENLRIKKWEQERNAMPGLRHLVIRKCRRLTVLPNEHLRNRSLQDVEVFQITTELEGMLRELKEKVGFKLQWLQTES